MSAKGSSSATVSHGSDFATNSRLIMLSAFGLLIGVMSTLGAAALLAAIRFFTNLFFFGRFSLATTSPADNRLGLVVVAIPALGGLIVGLMARYGSEKIRGHGIPEAIEAILFGKSRMSPKIAILKPLSSGIAIGSGGPFGAEGPVILTGGAVASLLAQAFHLTASERKALLVAGACAGMTAVFGTPLAAILLAVELLLFELRPVAGRVELCGGGIFASPVGRSRAAVSASDPRGDDDRAAVMLCGGSCQRDAFGLDDTLSLSC
jgi:CIC family chloride channel protein